MRRSPRRGAIVILAAVLLVVMVGLIALTVDLGFIAVARTELQGAADAAALAGVAKLPEGESTARSSAETYVLRNVATASNDPDVTVTPGNWNRAARKFSPRKTPLDALRVDIAAHQTPLFFGGVFGKQSFDSGASATAIVRPRDIMLVLDFSGSMNSHHKIDQLKAAVDLFFDTLQETGDQDRVGFVRYSTFGELVMGLSYNYTRINDYVQSTKATGWTNIGNGMEIAMNELQADSRSSATKMMVIMTDGMANRPVGKNPRTYITDMAQAAHAAGIDLYTISFGVDADKTLMDEVAAIGNDVHFSIEGTVEQNRAELLTVFQKIALKRKVMLVQ